MTRLDAFFAENLNGFERFLLASVENVQTAVSLQKAMRYSLEAGGKRIRPMLVLAVIESFGQNPQLGLSAAAAVEMIHTYSLIHDDLPCMDDDDLRRGKPTNHKVFGDALATLAGDAMQPAAFHILTLEAQYTNIQKIRLVSELSVAAGMHGMVRGQVDDIEAEQGDISIEELEAIHFYKTAKLIEYSLVAGAILANASDQDIIHLKQFAKHIGIAFQIQDDILDIEGDEQVIGKPVGSDIDNFKSTYPAILGLAGAKAHLASHDEAARQALSKVACDHDLLTQFLEMVVTRKK